MYMNMNGVNNNWNCFFSEISQYIARPNQTRFFRKAKPYLVILAARMLHVCLFCSFVGGEYSLFKNNLLHLFLNQNLARLNIIASTL